MAGGKSSNSSSFGQELGAIAAQINRETDPVRRQFMSQLQQVLGGNQFTTSTIPLIQSGVKAARDAAGASLQNTQSQLARSGVAQSPFAAAISSLVNQQGEQAIASVPEQFSSAYIAQTPGAVSSIGGQALSGLAGAAQTNNQNSQFSFDLGQFAQGAGTGLGALLAA